MTPDQLAAEAKRLLREAAAAAASDTGAEPSISVAARAFDAVDAAIDALRDLAVAQAEPKGAELTERLLFEHDQASKSRAPNLLDRLGSGYISPRVQSAWESWLARGAIGPNWMPFALTVAAALDRGEDARMLFDEHSPIRDELRRLIAADRALRGERHE